MRTVEKDAERGRPENALARERGGGGGECEKGKKGEIENVKKYCNLKT